MYFIVLTVGLPDQGFEDSDNSSIFSSPSPKSRQRSNVPCSADVAHSSSVQLRQRMTEDDVCDAAVLGIQQQTSHSPIVPSTSDMTRRPLSFVLAFPDETSGGLITDSTNGQVLDYVLFQTYSTLRLSCFYYYLMLVASLAADKLKNFTKCGIVFFSLLGKSSLCLHLINSRIHFFHFTNARQENN